MRRRLLIARPFLVAASIATLIAAGFCVAQLLSSDSVIWTGRCIPATMRGGLAYYEVNGLKLEVPDSSVSPNSATRPTTVCYEADHPEQAMVPHTVTRVFEASLVLTPLAIAIGLALYGLVLRPVRIKDIDEVLPWPVSHLR